MSRFYVRPEDIKGDEILVSKEEAHHIVNVMRMSAGDKINAFDGTGNEYIGKISNITNSGLKIKIEKINSIKKESDVSIRLVQALPKRAKMDYIVEKTTELGVDEIIPLVTERTIVRLTKDRELHKGKHWQEVAISASKQCGRLDIPKVHSLIEFNDFIKEIQNYDITLMACLDERAKPLKEIVSNFKGKSIAVMIGPEGDFTPGEIDAALSQGAKLASLGHLVMRVDTAAIYMLSVLNYENSKI